VRFFDFEEAIAEERDKAAYGFIESLRRGHIIEAMRQQIMLIQLMKADAPLEQRNVFDTICRAIAESTREAFPHLKEVEDVRTD
jgi:hypothetical protein